MFWVKRTFVSVWGRRGWDACRDLWRLCVCDWERSGCDEDWYGWVLIRFLCCSYLSFSLWVFLCCSTFNLREMKCPPALELHSKCMCACACVCVFVVQCQRAVKTEQLLFIVTERTPMCRASATHSPYCLPTRVCACTCVCCKLREAVLVCVIMSCLSQCLYYCV